MKKIKILFLLIVGVLFIAGCSKEEEEGNESLNPNEQNLVTQVVTSQGGIINAPDGVQVVFPQGSINTNTEVTVGYTGNENLTIENSGTEIIGKPFTLKMKIDTLQQNIQIKIPKPTGYIQNKTAIIASINPKIPLEFQEVGNSLVASFDNLTLNIAKEINKTTEEYKSVMIMLVIDKHLPVDEELGLKQVSIDNSGKMIFSTISNITSDDKVLIMVHGWTSSPSACWTEFLKKIQPQIIQSGYTKFVTFGYYSGLPISNNGALFANQIKNQLNGATIDIVAHSMGGLVSRSAIETYNMASKVRNLVTLGTPHKGSKRAALRQLLGRKLKTNDAQFNQSIDLNTQGMADLDTKSDFIKNLNSLNNVPSTNYYPIAGISNLSGIIINDDGVVSLESALGIKNNSNGNIGQVFSFFVPLPLNAVSIYQAVNIPHVRLTGDNNVIAHVAEKLNSFNSVGIKNGLVAYYPFNGNANDESGNGNNGTVNGATLTLDRHGNANKAYSFDGVDDYIKIINSLSLQTLQKNGTFSFWINTNSSSVKSSGWSVLSKTGSNNNLGQYRIIISSNDKIDFTLSSKVANFTSISSIHGGWKHYCFVTENSTVKLYVNSILVQNRALSDISAQSSNNYDLEIGRDAWGAYDDYINARLDDIRIYNRILTEAEIKALFIE